MSQFVTIFSSIFKESCLTCESHCITTKPYELFNTCRSSIFILAAKFPTAKPQAIHVVKSNQLYLTVEKKQNGINRTAEYLFNFQRRYKANTFMNSKRECVVSP